MTKQELLKILHEYTPWETLHMQNLSEIHNMEHFNRTLKQPVTEDEKSLGLHLPPFINPCSDTFSEKNFFIHAPGQDIMIVQHDRYTPPLLHNHDFYELMYVYEGEFTQQIRENRYLMHTGDFCLLPPHVYHSLDVCNYSVVLNILIPKSVFNTIFFSTLQDDHNILFKLFLEDIPTSAQGSDQYIIFHTCGDTRVQEIILSMCMESLNKEHFYNHMLNTHLLLLLGLLLRDYGDTYDSPKINRKQDQQNFSIVQYIETHYKSLTLQEIAKQFHYSTQYMSHRIKELTGVSFTQYLLRKRMQAASELLIHTNLRITTISESVGYCTQEHFIRTFRKYYGTSPNTYRSTHQTPKKTGETDGQRR